MELGQLVEEGIAEIYLIDPVTKKLTLWEEGGDNAIEESVLIGGGQQGKVYAVVVAYKEEGVEQKQLCAVKVFGGKNPEKKMHALVTQSDQTSTQNNIIKLMSVVERTNNENETQHYSLIPFCGLFLENLMESILEIKKSNFGLYKQVVLHAVIDLLKAVKFMHDSGYVHGDIKSANIAYYKGHICLIDLDCALKIGEKVTVTSGSPLYMHPACFLDADFCARPENDIFSLGVFLKELLGDEATIEWMQKWKAREAEATKMMLLSELSKAQADRLREAPERSEMDSNLDLRARLSELKTDELQLKYIAEQMTSLSSQPTVAALLDCCEMLKKKLLADSEKTDPVAAQAKALQGFYESLIPVRFLSGLDSDIVSPLRCEDSRVSFFQLPRASAHRASAEEDSLTIGSSGVERSVASADLDADIEMDDQSSVLNKPTQ